VQTDTAVWCTGHVLKNGGKTKDTKDAKPPDFETTEVGSFISAIE